MTLRTLTTTDLTAAAIATAVVAPAAHPAPGGAGATARSALPDAFAHHRIVAPGQAHGLRQQDDFVLALLHHQTLPPRRRVRVALGDPAFDFRSLHRRHDIDRAGTRRDRAFAATTEREARGHLVDRPLIQLRPLPGALGSEPADRILPDLAPRRPGVAPPADRSHPLTGRSFIPPARRSDAPSCPPRHLRLFRPSPS